ncbi:MAG: hypothetical protein ACJ8JD_06290 [Chthoniobacterales bacterium]
MLNYEAMQVSFESKIRYKGHEYDSLEEVPAEIRAPLDKALARVWSGTKGTPELMSRIVISGHEFASSAELPPRYRRLLDDSLHALLPIDKAIGVAAAQEYSYMTRGTAGLITLFVGGVALATFLWQLGCFR